jgi:hypothetical protein
MKVENCKSCDVVKFDGMNYKCSMTNNLYIYMIVICPKTLTEEERHALFGDDSTKSKG